MLKHAFYLFCFANLSLARADDWDNDEQQALIETQNLLRSPTERNAYISTHPEAAQADQKAKALGVNPDAIYEFSAQILEPILKEASGDPTKISQNLEQAVRDPSSFKKSLTPEQRQKFDHIVEEAAAAQKLP